MVGRCSSALALWYARPPPLARRPAPPRLHLGDDDRRADVGDPVPRVGEPARAMVLARRIGRIRGENSPVLLGTLVSQTPQPARPGRLGVIIVGSTDLFHARSERLFLISLAPGAMLVAVVARAHAGAPERHRARRPARRDAARALVRVRTGLAVFRDPRRARLPRRRPAQRLGAPGPRLLRPVHRDRARRTKDRRRGRRSCSPST